MSFPRIRLLIVEDNPADIYLVRLSLTEASIPCDVEVIQDGAAAVHSITSHSLTPLPDVALVDLDLPRADGIQVAQALRNRPQLSGIPLLVYTSAITSSRRQELLDMDAVVTNKPTCLAGYSDLAKQIEQLAQNAIAVG